MKEYGDPKIIVFIDGSEAITILPMPREEALDALEKWYKYPGMEIIMGAIKQEPAAIVHFLAEEIERRAKKGDK